MFNVSVTAVSDSAIQRATITFSVKQAALASGDVVVYRYVDGTWTEVTVTNTTDEGARVLVTVEMSGFSYYAVGTTSSETSTATSVRTTTASSKTTSAQPQGESTRTQTSPQQTQTASRAQTTDQAQTPTATRPTDSRPTSTTGPGFGVVQLVMSGMVLALLVRLQDNSGPE